MQIQVLAMNYDHELYFLTNELQRKLDKLRHGIQLQLCRQIALLDYVAQDIQVNVLMRKVSDLEAVTNILQKDIVRLKHELRRL